MIQKTADIARAVVVCNVDVATAVDSTHAVFVLPRVMHDAN